MVVYILHDTSFAEHILIGLGPNAEQKIFKVRAHWAVWARTARASIVSD